MIVFGWNSFELDSCKPSSIGLPEELNAQYTIIKRQKYFHLFWIPFFSIGSDWVLKAPDGKQYEPSAELRGFLNALPINHKTPWYTFIGIILAVAGSIGFFIFEKVDSVISQNRYEEAQKIKYKEDVDKIKNAKPGYYYALKDKNYNNSYLKVLSTKNDELKCLISYKSLSTYNDHSILDAFEVDSMYSSFDTVVVNKTNLIKSLSESGNKIKTSIVENGELKELTDIYYIYEPVFESVYSGFEDGEFIYSIKNKGIPVNFVNFEKLTTEENNATINIASSPKIENGVYSFKGSFNGFEPKISGILHFKSDDGLSFNYQMKTQGTRIYLDKI